MDGQVQYGSLQEAASALVNQANNLDDPIDRFMQQQNQIGETGSAAWGGTAASNVVPVLQAIKADIVELQAACQDFSEKVNKTLENYAAADVQAEKTVTDIKA